MTIALRPALEVDLAARAQTEGLSTEEFVNRELERMVAESPRVPKLMPEERRLWREFVDNHDYIKAPPLSDEAISRESIYREREDKQL